MNGDLNVMCALMLQKNVCARVRSNVSKKNYNLSLTRFWFWFTNC